MKRIKSLVKACHSVWKNDRELAKSLIIFASSLCIRHPRTAFSILYYSLESLDSVYRYEREGRRIIDFPYKSKVVEPPKVLFILGSGPSVNNYTQKQWEHIKNNESWGFNAWFCHDFVPSTYIVQSLPLPKNNPRDSFEYRFNEETRNMLIDKKQLYHNTKFIVRGDTVNRHSFYNDTLGLYLEAEFGEQIYHLAELSVTSTSTVSPLDLLKYIYDKGFFNTKSVVQPIPKFGSTVTELISLALMRGHKKIVLCGIDMNDGGHFYDNEDFFLKYPVLREMSVINNSGKDGGHEHMDKSVRPYTVKDYILALNDFAKEYFNASIFVMNESSKLYPDVEKYSYLEDD